MAIRITITREPKRPVDPRPSDRTGVISAEMDPDYDPPSTSLNPPSRTDKG